MGWDEEHARRLTRKVDRVLLQLYTKKNNPPRGFCARMEILVAEKRAAYETKNMARYEAALNAIAASARQHLTARQ